MAKNNQNQAKKNEKSVSSADKQKSKNKDTKKGGKTGLFVRVKRFFRDLKAELKRVIWPSKDKMIHSTAVVLSIILASVLVVWAVDTVVNGILTATGFYEPLNVETTSTTTGVTGTTTVGTTESTDESDSTTVGTVEVTDPTDEEDGN